VPLPVILTGLARVGAALAARAGAPAAARVLAGLARQAAPGAARRAAAAAARRAGSSAATTAAGTGGGLRVLENTTLTNARSLFQAIYGQTPPAGAAAAAAHTTAAAPQLQAAAATPAAAVPGTPAAAPAAAGLSAPGAAAAPPSAPAAGPPPGPARPPPPGSTPPASPKPQQALDRMRDAWERGKALFEQARQRFEPVSERVKNLSLDDRYKRLEQSGRLLEPNLVGRQLGIPTPSREQTVAASEAEEERQRQAEIQQSRSAQVGQAAWSAGKRAVFGAMVRQVPGAALAAPLWLYPVITGFERLGRTLSETNRDLVRFDERIADSFARLDFAQLRSRQQMAQATGGSATMLNNQLAALIRELQPVRESVTTFLNTAGGSIVFIARMAAFLLKWHPLFVGMHKTAQIAERVMGKGQVQQAQAAAKDFMRDIRDGKFERRKVKRP
jgi:hypothetical protein